MGLFKGCNLTQLFYSSNYFDIEALVLVVDSASESPRDVFLFGISDKRPRILLV